MSERAKKRDPERPEYERDENAWRKSNCVFSRDGAILYPFGRMPCEHCGLERSPSDPKMDHPFTPHPDPEAASEEVCACGWHESYHRDHDCVKDNEGAPIACGCAGGQPWSCCMNYHARQQQFLLQKLANTLRAAAEKS